MDVPRSRAGGRFGPYELRSLLGRGGMGEVYEAYDTGKDRLVALKLLAEGLADDPAYRERFRRESRAVAGLSDPHIIPIHDWGEIDGVLYIDMRLVRGENLRTRLRRHGAMDPDRAVDIIEQVAAALDAAHTAGLVHRDVKPANILVTAADFAYLADFGIARSEGDSRLTMVGTAPGTYTYMAPERFDAGPVTGRADTYSLACVLHECLTGATPFPVHSVSVLIRAHLSDPPPRPSLKRSDVPPALDAVIAHAMAKTPDGRYGTAGEFAGAARAALGLSVGYGYAAVETATVGESGPFVAEDDPDDYDRTPVESEAPASSREYGGTATESDTAAGPISAVPFGPDPSAATSIRGYLSEDTDPGSGADSGAATRTAKASGLPQRDKRTLLGQPPGGVPAPAPEPTTFQPFGPEGPTIPARFPPRTPAPPPEPDDAAQPTEVMRTGTGTGRPSNANEPTSLVPRPSEQGADARAAQRDSETDTRPPRSHDTSGTLRIIAPRDPDQDRDTSGDLPVIRPTDPTLVRPDEFRFAPLPEPSERPTWESPSLTGSAAPTSAPGDRHEATPPPGGDYSPYRDERTDADYPSTRAHTDYSGAQAYDDYDPAAGAYERQPTTRSYPDGPATQAYENDPAARTYENDSDSAARTHDDYESGPRPYDDYDPVAGAYEDDSTTRSHSDDPAARTYDDPTAHTYDDYDLAAQTYKSTPAARAYDDYDPADRTYDDDPAAGAYDEYDPATQTYKNTPATRAYDDYDPATQVYEGGSAARAYDDYDSAATDYDDESGAGEYGSAARGYDAEREEHDYTFDGQAEYDTAATDYEDPYPDSRRRSIVLPIVLGVLAVALAAVAGTVGWHVVSKPGSTAPSVASGPAGSNISVPQQSAPTTASTAPTTTAASPPPGATACQGSSSAQGPFSRSATGSSVTSCAFAEAVRKAYAQAAGTSGGPASVTAVSPVTGRSYPMDCTASGKVVTCTGGENAVVYVY
ncbi:serine/threonine-protein kinase [Nocardia thraciensis]